MKFGGFNCTMNKMDRDGGNKTQILYRCGSYYTLTKLILDNGLEDLWRKDLTQILTTTDPLAQDTGQTESGLY